MTDHARAKELVAARFRIGDELHDAPPKRWTDGECNQVAAYVRALEGERDAAQAQVAALRSLVEEYYQKTPLGHQPHMISQRVEDALADTTQAAADHDRRLLERAATFVETHGLANTMQGARLVEVEEVDSGRLALATAIRALADRRVRDG